eukprot:1195159-Prorocentrum_minimum.AAC.8
MQRSESLHATSTLQLAPVSTSARNSSTLPCTAAAHRRPFKLSACISSTLMFLLILLVRPTVVCCFPASFPRSHRATSVA